MSDADFDMYFYFEGEMDRGTQLAQTSQGRAIDAVKEALSKARGAVKDAMVAAQIADDAEESDGDKDGKKKKKH